MRIKNFEQLLSNAVTPSLWRLRKLALNSFDYALGAISPQILLKSRLRFADNCLRIDQHSFDFDQFKNIYVIGGGKATGDMTLAVEQILDGCLTRGCVNIPHEMRCSTNVVLLNRAGHPVPDEAGVCGVRQMVELAEQAGCDDLVICLLSGGGSSLMPLPRGTLSLADKKELTAMLLKSGASINEINTVRKHISDFKGGWLARRAYPATVLNLILSDVIGDPLDFIASGPTVPDSTTFADAVEVLQRYHLWGEAPDAVIQLLTAGCRSAIEETPKAHDPAFERVFNCIVGNNRSALSAVGASLSANGIKTVLLPTAMSGDAAELGRYLAGRALEISRSDETVAIIAGGEATVRVRGGGRGGRNQELALAAVERLSGIDNVLLAALATDGIDGPTDACGAIVDGYTLAAAQRRGLDPEQFLQNNDAYNFFNALGELVVTGYTGSNVNDIYILLAAASD
ncbi:MAG: hypothetical protein A2W80_14230 [Candidatus Riflebacteria bacterium GWC2_50_8]|nr:MAG: hypothetical protein A2W80_14230 [Candidatus Riflebacteria bacterium GWC2_50_8]